MALKTMKTKKFPEWIMSYFFKEKIVLYLKNIGILIVRQTLSTYRWVPHLFFTTYLSMALNLCPIPSKEKVFDASFIPAVRSHLQRSGNHTLGITLA